MSGVTVTHIHGRQIRSEYYILNSRCDTELGSSMIDDGDDDRTTATTTDGLVRDVLGSLRVLHWGGMLHADIHDGNIMLCFQKTTNRRPRFKLVDWDKAVSVDDLVAKLRAGEAAASLRSIRSPLFALAASPTIARLARRSAQLASAAALAIVATWASTRLSHSVLTCRRMRRALKGIAASFVRFVVVNVDDDDPVGLLLANKSRLLYSVDLFAFGVTLFATLCRCANRTRAHERVWDLAVRLTHFDHPHFVGDSASRALSAYKRS